MTNWYHRQQHRDSNHKAIVAALTYHGAIVADMGNAGGGIPDLRAVFAVCYSWLRSKPRLAH